MPVPVLVLCEIRAKVRSGQGDESRQVLAPREEAILAEAHDGGGTWRHRAVWV